MNPIYISIIIASRHRETILWETVQKAIEATAGNKVEIIVVNDGDSVFTIPEGLANKISCFNNPSKGVSAARNFGVKNSTGQLLFFIDDDMWVTKEAIEWIEKNILPAHNVLNVYNLNWHYPPSLDKKLLQTKVGRYLLNASYHTMWGRMKTTGKEPARGIFPFHMVMSGSLLLSKEIFIKAGGYNEGITFQSEDNELAKSLLAIDANIYCVFDVMLYHNQQDRLDVKGFLSRISQGYQTQFEAAQKGLLDKSFATGYEKTFLFEACRKTEPAWLFLLDKMPGGNMLGPVTTKLIGMLSGLQRYKAWKTVFKK